MSQFELIETMSDDVFLHIPAYINMLLIMIIVFISVIFDEFYY